MTPAWILIVEGADSGFGNSHIGRERSRERGDFFVTLQEICFWMVSSKPASGPRRCEHVRRHNFRLARHPPTIVQMASGASNSFSSDFEDLHVLSDF